MKPMVLVKDCVLNVMAGRQTQDRRIINDKCLQAIDFEKEEFAIMYSPPHQHDSYGGEWFYEVQTEVDDTAHIKIKPRYQVGDKVYVAEGYQILVGNTGDHNVSGNYLADDLNFTIKLTDEEWDKWIKRKYKFRPISGRFMYKSLARTILIVAEVRVERVQDISEEDAVAEGVQDVVRFGEGGWKFYDCLPKKRMKIIRSSTICKTAKMSFQTLWNSIHGEGAFKLNPYVWVYKFDKE